MKVIKREQCVLTGVGMAEWGFVMLVGALQGMLMEVRSLSLRVAHCRGRVMLTG